MTPLHLSHFAAAVVFALFPKLWFKAAALIVVSFGLVLVQWALLHTLGVVFEALVPIVGLWLHSVIERLM